MSSLSPFSLTDEEELDEENEDSHERMKVVSEHLANTWSDSAECHK